MIPFHFVTSLLIINFTSIAKYVWHESKLFEMPCLDNSGRNPGQCFSRSKACIPEVKRLYRHSESTLPYSLRLQSITKIQAVKCCVLLQVYHKLGLEDEWDVEDEEASVSPKEFAPDLCHPLCQCEKCRKYQQVEFIITSSNSCHSFVFYLPFKVRFCQFEGCEGAHYFALLL